MLTYQLKWIILIIGLFIWIPGVMLGSLSYGTGGGFFPPTETDVQLGKIGTTLFLIGLPVFFFGLFFPSREKVDMK